MGDVKGFEFLENLRGEDVVDALKLGSASSDVAWDEGIELLKNTVTKGKLEVLDDKVIKLSELLKSLSGDREVAIGFGIKLHSVFEWERETLGEWRFKGDTCVIEEERHSTVIDLIGDGEGRVIVIRCADEPDILRNEEFAIT